MEKLPEFGMGNELYAECGLKKKNKKSEIRNLK